MSIQGSGRYSGSEDVILEIKRQLFHLFAILLWLIPILYFPTWLTLILFLAVISVNLAVVLRIEPFFKFFGFFIDHLEREKNRNNPSLQAFYANIGILVSFLIFGKLAVVGVIVLAVGDSFSTFVGKIWGKNNLFYSEKKTVEGSLAFFISVYLVMLLVFKESREAVFVTSVSALLESFELNIDDNLLIPLVSTAVAYLM